MGIEAAVLGPILGATIGTAGSFITQSANASAQSSINKKTMEFNRVEAQKARDFSAAQAVIDRQFNSSQAALQRQFAAEQGAIGRNYDAQQALLARQFEERMSSSAHQREVNDLRLAGLNPILSATGGSGASTPAAPVVGAPAVTGNSASHSGAGTSQANVSGLNAYMKQDILGKFVNTAMDGLRLGNDMKEAEAKDLEAHSQWLNAQTNAKRQTQDALESMERITNIKSDTKLKEFMSLSQEKQVSLYAEKIKSEIQERTDKHNLSEVQQKAVMISANAAATAAGAQAHLADIQDRIQSAESPERVAKLQKEAQYWQSEFDKNKWIMDDPEKIMQREWWKHNEGAAGVKEAAEILGKVFHVGIGLHGITSIGPGSSAYQDSKIGFK